jgi:streptogramin lyase
MTIKLSSLKKRKNFKKRLTPPTVGIVTFVGDALFQISDNEPFFECFSGTIGPEGDIYCFPWNNNAIIKIDSNTGTASTIPLNPLTGYVSTYAHYTCSGTVLSSNGKIYSVSLGQFETQTITILEYNPLSKTIIKIPIDPSFDCRGLCLHPNGKIYAAPLKDKVLEIDPVAGISTTGTFGIVAQTSTFNWAGTVLGSNGKMYGIPLDSGSILEIDPIIGTATTFGNLSSGGFKWWGGFLAPNGKIYGIPSNATTILEIDPINRTVSTFGNITERYFNGFLGPDGKIYFFPYNGLKILKLDPDTKTISDYHTFNEIQTIGVGILAKNGNVYCPPSGTRFNGTGATTNKVLKVSIGTASKPNPYIISPYSNNF